MPDEPAPLRGWDLIGLGGLLVGAVVGGMVLGLLVDHVAGTSPLGALLGIAVGIALGAAGFIARVRRALRNGPEDQG